MNIKKTIILSLLLTAVTIGSYSFYSHSLNNKSGASYQKIDSSDDVKKNGSDNELINSNNLQINANKYFLISFLISIILNLLTILSLVRVLAWRKTATNGMMAVVPTEVMNSIQVVSQNQSKIAQWLQSEITVISKALIDQVQSIEILKKELNGKDEELAYFKSGSLSIEKDKTISKLVKLHSFLKTLEDQVTKGGVKHEVAIGFLKDELADLFVEFNITEINPTVLTPIKNLPIEGYSIKEVVQVNDVNLNQTVAELLESGYYLNFADGKGKVIRAATLKINKFGE
jgi:hypothetical protein